MVPRSPAPGDSVHPVIFCVEEESMEDVTELISKVSQELGPDTVR